MMKSKVINKKGITQVLYKAEKGLQINEPEIQTLRGEIPGLLPMQVELSMRKYRLLYDVTGYIPLKDFLVMPLTSNSLSNLLKSALNTLKMADKMFLRQENIVFDTDRIYINAMQQSVNFIYIPIRFYESEKKLRDFLLDIIQYGSFDKTEDNTYVKEYIKILNDGMTFSVFELEEYVKKIEKNDFQESNKQIQCAHCKTFLSEKTKFCPVCGTKVSGLDDVSSDDVYNPLKNIQNKAILPVDEIQVRNIKEDKIEKANVVEKKAPKIMEIKQSSVVEGGTQGLSDESTLMDADYNQTMLLTEMDFFTEYNPYLIRLSNNEKIFIRKYEFKIGKNQALNDYVVTDNKVVSGSHAKIVIHDEEVFIIDVGSLNGTKINGVLIEKNVEHRLSNNDKLRLANEEFIFSIEE